MSDKELKEARDVILADSQPYISLEISGVKNNFLFLPMF